MSQPKTRAGRALLERWKRIAARPSPDSSMARHILAIEAEAAAGTEDEPLHTDDEYVEYGISQYRRGRAQAEAEAAAAPAALCRVCGLQTENPGMSRQDAEFLTRVSDPAGKPPPHRWLQKGDPGYNGHRGTDSWECACTAWGSHSWQGFALHLLDAYAIEAEYGPRGVTPPLDVERLKRCPSLMAILNRLGKFNDAWWDRLAAEYAGSVDE